MDSNPDPTIISFGEVLYDCFPGEERLGGAPANVAFHLNQLGSRAILVSATGEDTRGKRLRAELKVNNIETRWIQRSEHPTGTVHVSFDEIAEPCYTITESVAWDNIQWEENEHRELADNCEAFCFSTLAQRSTESRKTLRHFLAKLPAHALIVYDLNIRPPFYSREIIDYSLHQADVVKLNRGEWEMVKEQFHLSEHEQLMQYFSISVILQTLGTEGSKIITNEGEWWVAAKLVPEHTGDAVGVGDAYVACAVHHLMKESDPKTILVSANRYAGAVAAVQGAMGQISENEIKACR